MWRLCRRPPPLIRHVIVERFGAAQFRPLSLRYLRLPLLRLLLLRVASLPILCAPLFLGATESHVLRWKGFGVSVIANFVLLFRVV